MDHLLQYEESFALLCERTKSTLFPKMLMSHDHYSFCILSVHTILPSPPNVLIVHLHMNTDNFNVREKLSL